MEGHALNSAAEQDLFDKYLRAWQNHDTNLVREIFDVSAEYKIEGKPSLYGVEAICAYWERNKKRQYNLKICPPLKQTNTSTMCSFVFCVNFVDLEEKEKQTVYGLIALRYANGKIFELSESYLLDRRPFSEKQGEINDFRGSHSLLPAPIRRGYWHLKNFLKQTAEFLLTRVATIMIAVMAILLGFSAFKLTELPDWLLRFLSFAFSDVTPLSAATRETLTVHAYRNLSAFTSLLVFVSIVMNWLRYQIRQPIKITNLQAPDHDLLIMKNRFKLARDLIVYAGDFDFVGRDAELRRTFQYLHAHGGLTLVSDKAETEVRKGFGNRPDAISLLEGLKQNQKIHFSSNLSIRCSIVRGWLGSEIIYRYDGGGADSLNNLHLCIMRGRREAGPLMELLEKLVRPTMSLGL
jgi:hypothetical protein